MEEVVSIRPSDPNKYTMHTTRSWEFVGLEEEEETQAWIKHPFNTERQPLLPRAGYGKQIIVGLLDSGNTTIIINIIIIYYEFLKNHTTSGLGEWLGWSH